MKNIFLGLLLYCLAVNQAFAALAVDASANANSGASVSLTTTKQNDIIILFIVSGSVLSTCNAAQVSDTAGLTWFNRRNDANTAPLPATTAEVYAVATNILTSDSISINGTNCLVARTQAIAISGADPAIPFDVDVAATPYHNEVSASPDSITASTANANTLLLAFIRGTAGSTTFTRPAGFTFIDNAGSTAQENSYKIVSSAQSSVAFSYSYTVSAGSRYYLDAIQIDPASLPGMLLDSAF